MSLHIYIFIIINNFTVLYYLGRGNEKAIFHLPALFIIYV